MNIAVQALRLFLFALALFCLPSRAGADTLTVTSLGDNDPGCLRAAILNAYPGDTIDFAPNVRGAIVLVHGNLLVNRNLTIKGPGAKALAISANHNGCVFYIDNCTVDISGLTIRDGKNTAPQYAGGGVFCRYSSLRLEGCTIFGNSNTHPGGGVGLYHAGTTVSNCIITGNSGAGAGGGVHAFQGNLTLTGGTISANHAVANSGTLAYGGGVYCDQDFSISDCAISGNSATFGGGLYAYKCRFDLTKCKITANKAINGDAGAILSSMSAASLSDCLVSGNSASVSGTFAVRAGGLLNYSGTAECVGCSFATNTALASGTMLSFGGAIFNSGGVLSMADSAISANRADDGGGIRSENSSSAIASVTLANCTISGNTSKHWGGGIDHHSGASLSLSNCTISGNASGYDGAGINNDANCLSLISCTVTANKAGGYGGGIRTPSPAAGTSGSNALRSSIVAGNSSAKEGADLRGSYVSLGHNLIGDPKGNTGFANGANGDLTGTVSAPLNAKLGKLADNGGPTLTHALLLGSPAIDAGDDALIQPHFNLTGDQRGAFRIFGQHADIGAFEVNPTTVSIDAATGITPSSAILNAKVNANGVPTPLQFSLNGKPISKPIAVGDAVVDQSFSLPVANLAANTLYSFSVTVGKAPFAIASGTATFVTLDHPPVAKDVTLILTGSSACLNLLGFASDPDHDPLSVSAGQSANGSVSCLGSTLTYAGSPALTGSDSFPYYVNDGHKDGIGQGMVRIFTGNRGLSTGAKITFVSGPIWTGSTMLSGTITGTISSFGIPAIGGGQLATVAQLNVQTPLASGTASISVVLGGSPLSVIAAQGDSAPDVTGTFGTFSSFTDPVVDDRGHVAFLAKITGTGVTQQNNTGIWTDAQDGILRLVRRTGSASLQGGRDLTVVSIKALSIQGNGEIVFTGSLGSSPSNSPGITFDKNNNTALWCNGMTYYGGPKETMLAWPGFCTSNADTLESFQAFDGLPLVTGQSRVHPMPGMVEVQALMGPKNARCIFVSPTDSSNGGEFATNDPYYSNSIVNHNVIFDANWLSLGSAIAGGSKRMFLGSCRVLATSKILTGVYLYNNGDNYLRAFALVGDSACDETGAPIAKVGFAKFFDPVIAPDGHAAAFLANIYGAGITAQKNMGLWWTGSDWRLHLVAQTGVAKSFLPKGAVFQTFNSLAIPSSDTSGPIFVATLSGLGITSANNFGLWCVDSQGAVVELLRTGDPIQVDSTLKVVKAFDVIGAGKAPSTPGATRSFDNRGAVSTSMLAYRVTFTDNTQAVLSFALP